MELLADKNEEFLYGLEGRAPALNGVLDGFLVVPDDLHHFLEGFGDAGHELRGVGIALGKLRQLLVEGQEIPGGIEKTSLYDSVPDVLSQLIRTALIPKEGMKFIVADFSAI